MFVLDCKEIRYIRRILIGCGTFELQDWLALRHQFTDHVMAVYRAGNFFFPSHILIIHSCFSSFFSHFLPVGNPRQRICQCQLNWKNRDWVSGALLVEDPRFLAIKPEKRTHSCESTCQCASLIPCLPNYLSVFFAKEETWMRWKAFYKSPSWLPSMSTVLGVRGRTNYIHSQHTLLLHNRVSAWIR